MDIRSNSATQDQACALCGACYVPAVASAYTTPGLCPGCFSRDHYRELDRVISAKRKLADGAPHDLTLYQWLATVSAFEGRCALCNLRPFEQLSIWIPALGVSAGNVAPLCRSCAWHKENSFLSAMERVRAVLSEGI